MVVLLPIGRPTNVLNIVRSISLGSVSFAVFVQSIGLSYRGPISFESINLSLHSSSSMLDRLMCDDDILGHNNQTDHLCASAESMNEI